MTHGKTWTALMLAASTLALSSLPLAAQESTAEEAVTPDASAEGAATAGMAAEGTATGEAATDGTMTAQDTTATDGEAATGTGTDMAQGEAATTGDAAEGTVTAEEGTATDDAAAAGTETQVAEGEAAAGMDGEMMSADAGGVANPPETPNADMQAVLDKLAELGAPPIGTVSVEEQRAAPTPADAVMALMEERGIEMPAELAAIATREVTYPDAGGGEQPIRIYTPEGEGPFPLIVYFHGGGWVLADLDTYDASARALAAGANAVVASVEYRHAPENPFPAAHEDANAAYAWIVENSGDFNADAERLAVAGESAGGNLAMNVAINARDAQLIEPDHMLLVYPVANDEMTTPSYEAYADAQPLSRDAMMWFVENVFEDPSQAADPRIDLIERDDLAGLPPATVINAEIDPLQSEGEILAQRLQEAGIEVQQMTYSGVTHEFFGMGTVVPQAEEAVTMATTALSDAFGAGSAEGLVNDPATADAAGTTDAATGEVTAVEPTAAETPDAMEAEGAMTTEDDAAMEGMAEPMEGEAATADQ